MKVPVVGAGTNDIVENFLCIQPEALSDRDQLLGPESALCVDIDNLAFCPALIQGALRDDA